MIPSDLPCFPSSLPNFAGIAGNQLTQEHVHQLVHLLNQAKVTQPDANPVDQNTMTACAGNNFVSCLLSFNSKPWVLDLVASQNMFSDSNMFHALKSLPQPINVTLPNSSIVRVTHSGIVGLFPDLLFMMFFLFLHSI